MDYTFHPEQDVSQHKTQEVIFKYFSLHPARHHLLCDVGAFGRFLSNSFALLKLGWRGLLIEPNLKRKPFILEEFAGLDFKFSDDAISDHRGIEPFFIHKTTGYDSLSPDWHANDKTGDEVLTPVSTLTDILFCHGYPTDFDLLTVDAEGFDEKIISKLFSDNYFKPRLIVTEADSYPCSTDLFIRNGYKFYALAGPKENGNLVFALGL